MTLWHTLVAWMAEHIAWTPVDPPPAPPVELPPPPIHETAPFADVEAIRKATRRLTIQEAELDILRRQLRKQAHDD